MSRSRGATRGAAAGAAPSGTRRPASRALARLLEKTWVVKTSGQMRVGLAREGFRPLIPLIKGIYNMGRISSSMRIARHFPASRTYAYFMH